MRACAQTPRATTTLAATTTTTTRVRRLRSSQPLVTYAENGRVESSTSADDAKSAVLEAIAETRRNSRGGDSNGVAAARAVETAVATLERMSSNASASGSWTLAYSAKTSNSASSPLEALGVSDEIVQSITSSLYGVFFKFAPWLAGSQETGKRGVRNEQCVDLDAKRARNDVYVELPPSPFGGDASVLHIGVDGEVVAKDALGWDAEVTFTSFDFALGEFPKVSFPLPRPRGALRTTYCDDTMRVSRGSRGGMFVLTRLRARDDR